MPSHAQFPEDCQPAIRVVREALSSVRAGGIPGGRANHAAQPDPPPDRRPEP